MAAACHLPLRGGHSAALSFDASHRHWGDDVFNDRARSAQMTPNNPMTGTAV